MPSTTEKPPQTVACFMIPPSSPEITIEDSGNALCNAAAVAEANTAIAALFKRGLELMKRRDVRRELEPAPYALFFTIPAKAGREL
mmetsp:Transcript_94743/g.272751  ORF Transcript_94743/g.272751 Transcript_94743/m.272751 type:complete len:86 (-) Transcript_94743:53-310(-)